MSNSAALDSLRDQNDALRLVIDAARDILGAEQDESLLSVCGRLRDMLREHVNVPSPVDQLLRAVLGHKDLAIHERDRRIADLEKEVALLNRDRNALGVWGCTHCGRVYILGNDKASADHGNACDCGAKCYPVSRKLKTGCELRVSRELGGVVRIVDRKGSGE